MGSRYFALRRAGSCKLAFQHRAAHACHADIGELAHRRAACKIHSHIVVQTAVRVPSSLPGPSTRARTVLPTIAPPSFATTCS